MKIGLRKIVLISFLIIFFLYPNVSVAQENTENFDLPPVQKDEFYIGRIVEEPTDSVAVDYGQTVTTQFLKVELLDGPEEGRVLDLRFDIIDGSPEYIKLEKSDKVVVAKSYIRGEETYYISDVYRLNWLWYLLILFVGLVILFARFGGVRSVLGLAFSFFVIAWFIVPRIIDGQNALVIGMIGTLLIACVSLFIAHGFKSRTAIAFTSTIVTIGISLILAWFFTGAMHMFGLGTEEAFYLQTTPEKIFNLRGILLAGIIIGTLGVLDDITTAQAAVVEELHKTDRRLRFKGLYSKASSVGREHIISLVNTLVLAYTGASLPLLLLFQIYEKPFWIVLNSEILIEEILRMIIGSIALVVAVPLTTALASWYYGEYCYDKKKSLS